MGPNTRKIIQTFTGILGNNFSVSMGDVSLEHGLYI